MPQPTCKDVLDRLFQDVVNLHLRWEYFTALFSSESNIEQLNRIPNVIAIMQLALIDDILLAIARILGPKQSVGNDQVSLLKAASLLPDSAERDLIVTEIKKSITAARPIILRRNNVIAHRNLAVSLGTEILSDVKSEVVSKAVADISSLMDKIGKADHDCSYGFGGDEYPAWYSSQFVRALQLGCDALNAENRAKRGEYTEEI